MEVAERGATQDGDTLADPNRWQPLVAPTTPRHRGSSELGQRFGGARTAEASERNDDLTELLDPEKDEEAEREIDLLAMTPNPR